MDLVHLVAADPLKLDMSLLPHFPIIINIDVILPPIPYYHQRRRRYHPISS